MFGFFFGTLCLFGLLGMAKHAAFAHHHGYAYAGCGRGGYGAGPWGHARRGPGRASADGFARAAGEVLKRRLDIDDEQEMIVDHALIDARKAFENLHKELEATRAGIADAFRGEAVDDGALAAAFTRHDDAIAKARREVVSSLKQVHAVLSPEQRKQAAELLAGASARGWWS